MAKRRMFSNDIIGSARFIKMPVSSRELYFQLGLGADDDGVVEAFTIMQTVGATEDDLKVLVTKGFVTVLNEDLVTYINDWLEHNQLRADRKIDSRYKNLLLQIVPDAQLLTATKRADLKKKNDSGRPLDDKTPPSIGKDSIGKDSIEKEIDKEKAREQKRQEKEKSKKVYGEFENVKLTDDEYNKLKTRFSDYKDKIENLSIGKKSKGYKYNSDYATILSWARKEEAKQPKDTKPKPQQPKGIKRY